MTDLSDIVSSAYWRVNPPDADPIETREWLEAFDALVAAEGRERATFILRKLLEHARARRVPMPPVLNTPYKNSVSLAEQAQFPGNLELESRIASIVRWNALAMVVRANRAHPELGGHIASYASAADLFEVGFNHFFRGGPDGDLVYFQPHSAPGIYSRAFLEGRLSEENLSNYRRETGGKGLCSYCHPYLMPHFWQFPTGSMGLGPINAIYQAHFMRYLENRALLKRIPETAGRERKVWCFVGDGEMDEPESLAGLSLATREGLDNLIFVVNCNLQRLDGPVRGNGSVVQELEGLFAGAGWNVIKLLWGADWDALFARDDDGVLLKRLHETVDGEFQMYAATDGRFNREHFFNKYPELRALIAEMSDADIDRLRRGGHDPVKIYAAYQAASQHKGRPSVILAQTKKGYGMGNWGQGKMGTHQQKKLDDAALREFRDRFSVPLSDDDVAQLRFLHPGSDSAEIKYLEARRKQLGGYLPVRRTASQALRTPALGSFSKILEGTAREQSTTMIFVQLLAQLLKDETLGARVVPIVADEARTFGMQTLFRQVGIYSAVGQLYEPIDKGKLLYYREAKDGQVLEEGITETGSMASFIAAAPSYAVHGQPMIPFYIFYSMFGFQRTGDHLWAAGDSMARGFVLGATAGRTTLNGEGLQHEDGHSHLHAMTVPAVRAYDISFAFELAAIVEDGLKRMLDDDEACYYYITLQNENYPMPAMPEGAKEGVLRGIYRFRPAAKKLAKHVQLWGSGSIMLQVLRAQEILAERFGVSSDVWGVTSYQQLRLDALNCERENRLHPEAPAKVPYITQALSGVEGPFITASDYMKSLGDLVARWVPGRIVPLGTDGFGMSDTREALRRHFEVDAESIVIGALDGLRLEGKLTGADVARAIKDLGVDAEKVAPLSI